MKGWDDDWLEGKAGSWFAAALMAVVAVVVLLFCGCAPGMAVVAADRALVPVRDVGEGNYTYEPTGACTGWYVPNAVMLDLVDGK